MKNKKYNFTKRSIVLGLALVSLFSLGMVSYAAKSASGQFKCSGYYVGYQDSMTKSNVKAATQFYDSLNGQKTSATINTIIEMNNGTGRTTAGTPTNVNGGRSASASYSCPSGYYVLSATTRHAAQVNGNTTSKNASLN